MQRLFAYGTLEFPEVVRKLLGLRLAGEPANLPGYQRFLLVNRNYPGIIYNPSETVDGVLYHGLTPKLFKRLDRYEDKFYERRRVLVQTSDGGSVTAWAYVVPLKFKSELSTKPWNRESFYSSHLKRFMNVHCL